MASNDGTRPALLFMPDISGFTQFVNATEISHSQHIIAELLETLLESNQLGMKVSEIEGDAIFFYKEDRIPSPEEISEQCRKMFIAFRQQLKKYDLLRICNCGACSSASQLTLKIVAHEGNVSFMTIKDHEKLFGPDVILIHRLMKNDIPEHEYMMMTEQIPVEKISSGKKENEWIQFTKGSNMYDVGEVKYHYSPFKALYNSIPEPSKPELKIFRVKDPIRITTLVNAPMDFLYSKLIDLKLRAEVLPGVISVKIEDEKHNQMNKIGTIHECIREPEQGPAQTTAVEFGENTMKFTETGWNNSGSFDYLLEKTGTESCRMTFLIHIPMHWTKRMMFNMTAKKKIEAGITFSAMKIKEWVEKHYQDKHDDAHLAHEPAH